MRGPTASHLGIAATFLCAALAGAACLFDPIDGIPCGSDDDCPSAYFCDIPDGTCRAESGGLAPPALTVAGVQDDDDVSTVPFIAHEGRTELALKLENTGGSTAEDIGLDFGIVACVGLAWRDADVPAAVPPGATRDVPIAFEPEPGCDTPVIQDWFLTFSGRATRGTFNVNIRRE
jgi:hypothetical protein